MSSIFFAVNHFVSSKMLTKNERIKKNIYSLLMCLFFFKTLLNLVPQHSTPECLQSGNHWPELLMNTKVQHLLFQLLMQAGYWVQKNKEYMQYFLLFKVT